MWAIDFLVRTKAHLDNDGDLTQWVNKEFTRHRIGGYGRPITKCDERIQPLLALASKLDLASGPHVQLAFDVEQIVSHSRWELQMNVAALIAALSADQGLSAQEFYQYTVLSFSGGMFPCYTDTADKPEGRFFPIRCSRIAYQGAQRRKWVKDK